MSRRSFTLRLTPEVHRAVERLAQADLRSKTAEVEALLRAALRRRSVLIGGRRGMVFPARVLAQEEADGREPMAMRLDEDVHDAVRELAHGDGRRVNHEIAVLLGEALDARGFES